MWEQAEAKWKKALDDAVESGTINSEGNKEIIDLFRKGVKNGSYRKTEDIRRMLDELDDGYGNDDRGSVVGEERQTDINDGEVFDEKPEADRRGNLGRSTEDIEGRKYRLSDILGIVDEQSKEDVLAELLELKK